MELLSEIPDGVEYVGTRNCPNCSVVWHLWVDPEDVNAWIQQPDPDLSHCPEPHPLDLDKGAKCSYAPIVDGGNFAEMTPGERRSWWNERIYIVE